MSINVNDKNLGHATAYAYYKAGGGTMTEAEFTEFMADFGTASQTAVEAAQAALASKNAAQTAATTATNKASEATTAATTATTKAGEASTSASTAASAKDTAVSASQTATTKATEATTAAATATSAKTDAVAANTAAQSAKTAAQTAQTGAETAAASVAESAAQIQTNAEDISQLKSEFTVLTSDGVVPSAEQMLSDNYTEDSVPYHFRKTASDNADREELEIVGGSVAWNQLVNKATFQATKTENGITFTNNGDGAVTVSGTATAETRYAVIGDRSFNNTHKYLVRGCPAGGALTTYDLVLRGMGADNYEVGNGCIWNPNGNNWKGVYIQIRSGYEISGSLKFVPQMFDLTQMFGSTIADHIYALEQATAGAGVALFKKLFPKDYYAYDAGSMQSVSGLSAHKMVGFNQWDEEWEVGSIDASGNNDPDPSRIRSKNYTAVLPNTNYYFGAPYTLGIRWYAEDKSFISGTSISASSTNKVMESPSNACYLRFYVVGTTTYNHDICINLSDPTKNGTYEPYKAHSYPLDSDVTLRGIPKLDANNNLYYDGDVYSPSGKVTRRYGIVDLGNATWVYFNGEGHLRFGSSLSSANYGVSTNTRLNAICNKYEVVSYSNTFNNTKVGISIHTDGSQIVVYDPAYTDADAFKAAMSGVYLVYELATPTTETADPYQHLQQCDPSGTEEYVSTGIVPIGHNSFYPENLRAKVEQLPWNFANLIAPTESAFVATRNYVTGDLFIVNNVLYKATSNIANGGSITPNTNCTATTLAEIISALA